MNSYQPKPAPTAPREYVIPDEECLPKYFKEPAPTAEEQLPELDEFSHSSESAKVAEGYYRPHRFGDAAAWFAASCELADRALQRERQLLAALRSNREKDAQLAELTQQAKTAMAMCKENSGRLITAESKLRAESEALKEKLEPLPRVMDTWSAGRVMAAEQVEEWRDDFVARLRSIVDGKD